MGWWGTLGATEQLQFYPDSYLASDGTLYLHVKNTGSASAVIYKIEVLGIGTASDLDVTSVTGTVSTTAGGTEVTMGPGAEATITGSVGSPVAGAKYQVKVYTKAGNVYSITVEAKTG
jgi:hypothetical protein